MPILWTEAQFPGVPETGGADPALAGMAVIEAITRAFAPPTVPVLSGNGWRSVQTLRPLESRPHERP
jgi:hypothetical protein